MVAAAKYAPLGSRGAGGPLPHLQYRSFPAAEANAALNAATMVIVQFESWAAVEKAEEIMAVEGVDIVLIGTNDLLADLGLPGQFEHDKVREAYARTIAAAPQARQARGRRRARLAPAAHRRVREDGRALRLDRHRHRLPARRGHRARQAGARPRQLTSSRRKVATQRWHVDWPPIRGPDGRTHARLMLIVDWVRPATRRWRDACTGSDVWRIRSPTPRPWRAGARAASPRGRTARARPWPAPCRTRAGSAA